jgi:hypothetical protein
MDHRANGRRGAYASHAKVMREQRGLFDPDLDHRRCGHLGGTASAPYY